MKKILITILTIATAYVSAGQIWTQYDFRVDTPESAARIIAASNELMNSSFAKENFQGSSHLDVYISNGSSPATHSFAILQPSMAAHQEWMTAMNNSPEGQKFFNAMNNNSTPVSERINSFIASYGTASNDDNVWLIHQLRVDPSNVSRLIKAFEQVDEDIAGQFPGQFGLSAVAFGQDDVTHLLSVGYESIAEMESWEDQVATNKGTQKFLKRMSKFAEWKGNDLLFNALVFDDAQTKEDFLNNN
jgi:hypothetical protein